MSRTDAPNDAGVRFEGGNPIFRVRSVSASIEYYVRAVGFKLDWGDAGFASVSPGRFHLFLCEGDQGNPGSWVWIGVSDADALLEEYRATGVKVRHPPTNYSWAYEMREGSRSLGRRNHVHVLQGHVAGVGDVVARGGRDVNQHGRLEGAPWLPFEEGFTPAAQDHERFFVSAGGVPADCCSRLQTDKAAAHPRGLRYPLKQRAFSLRAFELQRLRHWGTHLR